MKLWNNKLFLLLKPVSTLLWTQEPVFWLLLTQFSEDTTRANHWNSIFKWVLL